MLNIYMVCLTFADILGNVSMIIISTLGYKHGGYPGADVCKYQCFVNCMHLFVPMWFNAFIGFEVYKILLATKRLENYQQPPLRSTLLVCATVFAFNALVSAATLFDGSPIGSEAVRGVICIPAPSNRLFVGYFVVVAPGVLIPAAWTASLMYRALRRELIDWRVIMPHQLIHAPTLHRSARDEHLKTSLGEEAHRRRLKQAKSVTLFFLRVLHTLALYLPMTALAMFASDIGLVFFMHTISMSNSQYHGPSARRASPYA